MKRATLFVLLLVSIHAEAQEKPAANQVTLKKGDRILFYGDSLTDQAQKPKGWVTLLREHFKKNHPDLDIDVTTFAVGGYPIVQRVKKLDAEVLAKKPTVVVIQGGVPDALRKFTDDEFKSALEAIIERLHKAEVRVIVCSCTSLGEKKDGTNSVDKRLDELAEVARQVARDKKVPLNDLRKAFKEYWNKNNPDNKGSGILTYDGNHFNDTGNQFVLEQMFKMFAVPKANKAGGQGEANFRKPKDDAELRYWLGNMVWHHQFSEAEIAAATGLSKDEIAAALKKFDISAATKPARPADAPLLVLPYPGGRHPRIGFLEGAIDPQRETKVSVFTPWDDKSYVVVDVPEAIFTNLGLTYLAHTHVPTIWEQQKIELEKLEWNRRPDGTLDIERRLPNGIGFGTKIVPSKTEVRMELWLKNGTKVKLTAMRVQNCVLLRGAKGFEALSNDNKVFAPPFAACKSADGKRWVITAWEPHQRSWGNVKCPCLHSDPIIPDCAPGATQSLRGWLSFYEGDDIHAEFHRIDKTGWLVSK